MKTKSRLVRIGNSRGVRLPKPLIEQAGLSDEVELDARHGSIIIRATRGPRAGIVAPLTTGSHPYPFRIPCRVAGKSGHVVLDQLRTVDQSRVGRRIARLAPARLATVLTVLQEMFAPWQRSSSPR